MRHVLILNSDKQEPLSVLQQFPDLRHTVMTSEALRSFYPEGSVVGVSDLGDVGAVLARASEVVGPGGVTDVVAMTERAVPTAAFLRSYFGLPGMKYDQALIFSNKVAMKRALAPHVPVMAFEPAASLDDLPARGEHLGWPVIVKPAFGAGSEDTIAIHSPSHAQVLDRAGVFDGLRGRRLPLIVERFADVIDEFHCDGVVRGGRVLFASASRYFAPPLTVVGDFHGSVHLSPDDPTAQALVDLHARVVAALGLDDGVTHLEVLHTAEGFVVGEVACRPGGGGITTSLRHMYGVDLWREHVAAALRLPPEVDGARPRHPGKVYGLCGLPAKGGTITRLSSADALTRLDGVYAVSMRYKPGDRLSARRSSVFFTGEVFFRLDHADDLRAFLRRLRDTYVCETDASVQAQGAGTC
ncbi:carboxylase [Deinococcus aerius]|uniref:Carboxylase n=1 Tax=Deinococcus aerius TaxID=200253 RepID=A0A2I9D2L4_9DEIO|nr:hypothetical protein [Deinococcus aerius]GBF04726.1 carboxylase [Deinococcus aerius]